jgi:hypothetical protein
MVVPVVAESVPPVFVHVPDADAVIRTCSLTPTVVLVAAAPLGAAARV